MRFRKVWATKWTPSFFVGSRISRWSGLFLEFAVSQGIAQVAGMLSGLIYVRLMPIDQYAVYAMALTGLGFVGVASDMGLTGALNYFWRQSVVNDRAAVEARIAAVLRLRSAFLVLASVICGALLLKMAAEQSLGVTTILACFALIVATAWTQMHANIGVYILRLQKMQRQSYYCEAAGSITRLLAAIAMIATGITSAWFGLVGGLLGAFSILAGLQYMKGRRAISPPTIGSKVWRELFGYIIPQVPTTIVYMAEGPFILWLAMTFGGQSPVSETFALGRISAIYAIIGNFIIAVVAPRLSGIADDGHFGRMVACFSICLVMISAAATMVSYLAPSFLLLLIGNNYAHLQHEVVLAMGCASVGLLITFLTIVNRLRGWVRLEPAVALCKLIAILVVTLHWPLHDSEGILSLMLLLSGVSFLFTLMITVIGLFAPGVVKARWETSTNQ